MLTNLGRVGSPAVRYRTGDRVRLADGPCPCGRTFARLEGGILGRLDDMLIVRGVNVFPSAIEGMVRRFPAIEEFQIEVFRAGELDEVRVLVEVGDAAGAPRVAGGAAREPRHPARGGAGRRPAACRATSSRPAAWCADSAGGAQKRRVRGRRVGKALSFSPRIGYYF